MNMNLQWAAQAVQKANLLPQATCSPTKKMEATKQEVTPLPATMSTCLSASVSYRLCLPFCNYE